MLVYPGTYRTKRTRQDEFVLEELRQPPQYSISARPETNSKIGPYLRVSSLSATGPFRAF